MLARNQVRITQNNTRQDGSFLVRCVFVYSVKGHGNAPIDTYIKGIHALFSSDSNPDCTSKSKQREVYFLDSCDLL